MANSQLTQEKLDALRSEYKPRRPCALLKYPRPKTKPEYQYIYPWLLPDETDPHFVFCTFCECRLSAKRSDLGKHEGSIKHTENAQRRSLQPKTESEEAAKIKWEYTDDEEAVLPFNTSAELCKTNDNEAAEAAAVAEEEEDDEDDGEADTEADYEPTHKRRISETDSQHSGMLEYLPLQVTINELPTAQLSSAPNHMLPQYPPASTAAQPCRITIKKVTAPLCKMTNSAHTVTPSNVQPHEITSKATITPIAAGSYAAATQRQQQNYQMLNQGNFAMPRDSFDLFFDSICATVKSLPPKLATEGKIRVMQLVGELELRAINEREAQPALQAGSNHNVLQSSAHGVDASTSSSAGQQNATVASTTK